MEWPGEETFPREFSTSVRDICGLVEFNFRSFLVPKTDKSSLWSPYLYTGLGFFTANDEGGIVIPLGVGVKFNYMAICLVGWNGVVGSYLRIRLTDWKMPGKRERLISFLIRIGFLCPG